MLLTLKIPLLYRLKFGNDEEIFIVSNKNLILCLTFLKNNLDYQCKLLSTISGVDFFNSSYRFGVIYDLLSLKYNFRLRIKVFLKEIDSIESITKIYKNANWWEREIWDLYGIYFNNHLDLRRILTDYGFEGYPMRKDFPLTGYVEIRYDSGKKKLILESTELTQEFRSFNFETPWK